MREIAIPGDRRYRVVRLRGGATASASVVDGNGSDSAAAGFDIPVRLNSVFGGPPASLQIGGISTSVPGGLDAMHFTFSVTFGEIGR